MSRVKTSAMPGAKVVAPLEYWWKLKSNGAHEARKYKGTQATAKPKVNAPAPKPNVGTAIATPKSKGDAATEPPKPRKASAAPQRPKGLPIDPNPGRKVPAATDPKVTAANPTPNDSTAASKKAPKKRTLTPASLISAINRGTVTNNIIGTVRNVNPEKSPQMHKALRDFDPTAGVRKALELIEARLAKKYVDKYCRARDWLTFGKLIEETGFIAEFGTAFFVADLPAQSALVYMSLIKVADSWICEKCYTVYDGEDEFYTWDRGLVRAVAELDRESHGEILKGLQTDLTAVVNSQSSGYGVDLQRPLSESQMAVKQILEGKEYTCAACREKDPRSGVTERFCSEACNQKLNYAIVFGEMAGVSDDSEMSEEDRQTGQEVESLEHEEGKEGGGNSQQVGSLGFLSEEERKSKSPEKQNLESLEQVAETDENTRESKRQKA